MGRRFEWEPGAGSITSLQQQHVSSSVQNLKFMVSIKANTASATMAAGAGAEEQEGEARARIPKAEIAEPPRIAATKEEEVDLGKDVDLEDQGLGLVKKKKKASLVHSPIP